MQRLHLVLTCNTRMHTAIGVGGSALRTGAYMQSLRAVLTCSRCLHAVLVYSTCMQCMHAVLAKTLEAKPRNQDAGEPRTHRPPEGQEASTLNPHQRSKAGLESKGQKPRCRRAAHTPPPCAGRRQVHSTHTKGAKQKPRKQHRETKMQESRTHTAPPGGRRQVHSTHTKGAKQA